MNTILYIPLVLLFAGHFAVVGLRELAGHFLGHGVFTFLSDSESKVQNSVF